MNGDERRYEEFVRAVSEMRRCQKDYFRTRDPQALERSKAAERKVDELVGRFFDKQRMLGFC